MGALQGWHLESGSSAEKWPHLWHIVSWPHSLPGPSKSFGDGWSSFMRIPWRPLLLCLTSFRINIISVCRGGLKYPPGKYQGCLTETTHTQGNSYTLTVYILLFILTISCTPGWPRTRHTTKDDHLLISLRLPPKCRNCNGVPTSQVFVTCWVSNQVLCALGKHS